MGRLTAQIPNEDPSRLSRVMDAKYRMIGVRSVALRCTALRCSAAMCAGVWHTIPDKMPVPAVSCGYVQAAPTTHRGPTARRPKCLLGVLATDVFLVMASLTVYDGRFMCCAACPGFPWRCSAMSLLSLRHALMHATSLSDAHTLLQVDADALKTQTLQHKQAKAAEDERDLCASPSKTSLLSCISHEALWNPNCVACLESSLQLAQSANEIQSKDTCTQSLSQFAALAPP